MPILKEIKLDKLIEFDMDDVYKTVKSVMDEPSELFIRNSNSGVSIGNLEDKIVLRSKSTDSSRTISVCLKFNEMCSVIILNHKITEHLKVPYVHKPIITDVLEIQFTGHLHGVVVPTSEKGLEVIRAKFNDVDLSHTHGYRMSVFAYNLNTHQVKIQGGISR